MTPLLVVYSSKNKLGGINMREEERKKYEFIIERIKAMQEDIKESEIRLDENRKALNQKLKRGI